MPTAGTVGWDASEGHEGIPLSIFRKKSSTPKSAPTATSQPARPSSVPATPTETALPVQYARM